MKPAAVERFVWGYGEQGYRVVSRSAGLSRELERDCLNEASRWSFGEHGFAITPVEANGRRVALLAIAARSVIPSGGGRAHRERAFAVARWSEVESRRVGIRDLAAWIPSFEARGALEGAAAGEVAAPKAGVEDGRTALALELLLEHGRAFFADASPDQLEICALAIGRLPPELRVEMAVGLGLSAPPPGADRTGLYRYSDRSVPEGSHLVALRGQSTGAEAETPLGRWLARHGAKSWALDGATESWDPFWDAMRGELGQGPLSVATIEGWALADLLIDGVGDNGAVLEGLRRVRSVDTFEGHLSTRLNSEANGTQASLRGLIRLFVGAQSIDAAAARLLKLLVTIHLQRFVWQNWLIGKTGAAPVVMPLPLDDPELPEVARRILREHFHGLVIRLLGNASHLPSVDVATVLKAPWPASVTDEGSSNAGRLVGFPFGARAPRSLAEHVRSYAVPMAHAQTLPSVPARLPIAGLLGGSPDPGLIERVAGHLGPEELRRMIGAAVEVADAGSPGNSIQIELARLVAETGRSARRL